MGLSMKRRIWGISTVLLTFLLLSGCGKEGTSTLRGQYVRTAPARMCSMREDTREAAFVFRPGKSRR